MKNSRKHKIDTNRRDHDRKNIILLALTIVAVIAIVYFS